MNLASNSSVIEQSGSDSPKDVEFTQDINSPSSIDGSDGDQSQEPHEQELSTSSNCQMRMSVQRDKISSTTVQEGNDELIDLDVEVYDQSTYEKGVFEQVNEAISAVDHAAQSTGAKINDLMRIIHSNEDHDEDQVCDPTERDEQVLQLTRLERLNRTTIKLERPDSSETLKSLPRIPKLPRPVRLERDSNANDLPSRVQIKKESITQREELVDDACSSSSEYNPANTEREATEDEEDEDDIEYDTESDRNPIEDDDGDNETRVRKRKKKNLEDDGDFRCYQARIKAHIKNKAKARLENISADGTELKNLDETVTVEGNLQIPKEVWDNLFDHQKTGVRWLWELHQLGTGGILGDEMGLGKTIQMIAFLTALRSSNIANAHKGYDNLGPVILVCPATVMHQWLIEIRKWWPPFRVAILHSTGTFSGDKKNLVQVINKSCGILIVSYQGVVIYQDSLHAFDWHYAILDEGHKIRNPDAQVTLACKRFRTPHRLILSGSPVQNNLKELWSIFDFIYPGKLGTLPVFMEQFAIPITQGGYANASDIQVQIAYKCSCVLRDTIKPFLLRRTKAEVNNKLKLPDRSEQVLFCKLTDKQRKLYEAYLQSPTVRDIKGGYCQIFVGLIQLRKICNHPDLFDATDCRKQISSKQQVKKFEEFFSEDETFGHYKKSGKMMVVDALLSLWKKQNHKVLLFTQSRQMLKIFTNYLVERNYKHLIMDGATPIGLRQSMIEEFNTKDDIFIFLLTTRVGGVGVNLIGANRIIIYDPDWNPSTDIQARERAWRIGQQRHVIIYRLLTAGTIEEKIYHRQVFKLYLTNRVLKDAKQKRFFKTNDLHELFTLGDNDKNIETKALFDDDLQINLESIKKSKHKKKSKKKIKRNHSEGHSLQSDTSKVFSDEKLNAMRERAKRLSLMIAQQYGAQANSNDQQVRIKIEPGTEAEKAPKSNSQPVIIKQEPGLVSAGPVENSPVSNQLTERSPSSETISKKSKHKKKKKSSSKQHVEYLVKQDIYRPDTDSEVKPDPRYKRDDYILERLFKSSNISGALKHDRIETDSTSDFKVVESEAEKVARDAIRALRESRRLCLDSSHGVPTWTGRNGQMSAQSRLIPRARGRAPPLFVQPTSMKTGTSGDNGGESLLSSIKKRNQTNPIDLAKSALQASSSQDSDDEERNKDFRGKAKDLGAEDIAGKIREFVLYKSARSGEAQTDELLDFFKSNFKPDKTAIFKALLYKMCQFQRRGDKGFWLIKTEFKEL